MIVLLYIALKYDVYLILIDIELLQYNNGSFWELKNKQNFPRNGSAKERKFICGHMIENKGSFQAIGIFFAKANLNMQKYVMLLTNFLSRCDVAILFSSFLRFKPPAFLQSNLSTYIQRKESI